MHHVKNVSKSSEAFWTMDEDDGLRRLVRLEPGEGGNFAIDPNQSAFAKGGAFEVSAVRKAAPEVPAKPAG